jgi:phosphohistidine phosphatase
MELYLLRHAIAVERGTPGYEVDSARPLTPGGARKMQRVAAGMAKLGLKFDLVLTSPYLRARQTAEVVAAVFRIPNAVQVNECLSPGGDQVRFMAELKERYGGRKGALLVGHEPDLSELASTLICGSLDAAIDMKKGSLCHLTAAAPHYGQCAVLRSLLSPRQLILLS